MMGRVDALGKYHPNNRPVHDRKGHVDDLYKKIANDTADLLREKQQAYGDSFSKAGDFLKILYPDGVPIDKYSDMLTIVRVFDKLMRIATDNDPTGENPWQDIVGYAILACSNSEKKEEV